jgi:hypothetical protein
MDELLIRVLTRLLRVHDELGEKSFNDAAHRALVAIALAVQIDADRKAGTLKRAGSTDAVVPFPISSSQRAMKKSDSSHDPSV